MNGKSPIYEALTNSTAAFDPYPATLLDTIDMALYTHNYYIIGTSLGIYSTQLIVSTN